MIQVRKIKEIFFITERDKKNETTHNHPSKRTTKFSVHLTHCAMSSMYA
jgi:hypothetical protein